VTYTAIVAIASSQSLTGRIAASAAEQGIADPMGWANEHRWATAAEPGWAAAWDFAVDNQTLDDNPDTGARPGVISDAMILAAVQAIIAEENTPPP
jgi:hypothetical protein